LTTNAYYQKRALVRKVKRVERRAFFYYYEPKAETFQIIVRIRDVPGALSNVLERLRDRVNLISSFSYSLDDGTAIWSGFGRALSPSETTEKLKRYLIGSSFVKDSRIEASTKGLLIDSFHTGLKDMIGVPRIVLSTSALRRMFDDIVKVLGSGGSTMLFEEGQSMGRNNGSFVKKLVGPDIARQKARDLLGIYGAMGWGLPTMYEWNPGRRLRLSIDSCFECDGALRNRTTCDFQRGHLVGLLSTFYDVALECNETKCRARGDPGCEFELHPSGPATFDGYSLPSQSGP